MTSPDGSAPLDGTFSVDHRQGAGTVSARPLLGGAAHVAVVDVPGGPVGVSLEVRDAVTGSGTIWWVDAATGRLGPPRRGRWVDGRAWLAGAEEDGTLRADVLGPVEDGAARREQHRSVDGGRTWAVESVMDLVRTGPAVDPPAAGDFAFLARTLTVDHHRRSRTGSGHESATATHRGATFLDGLVSVDEVGLPGGGTGMTFRTRDVATGTWSIRWVSSDRGRLEPPVHGRFADGVGTFVGAEDDQLVRFTWSDVETDRPRWLQELSTDGGRTWVEDWEMRFSPAEEAS